MSVVSKILVLWFVSPILYGEVLPSEYKNNQTLVNNEDPAVAVITNGLRNENNLLFDFREFNLIDGQTALFQNNDPNVGVDRKFPFTNIIARIQDKNQSTVAGTIKTSSFGKANVFLQNSSGFQFGNTASLDISGSFFLSSGDFIEFSNGARLEVNDSSGAPELSTANPSAFGFLSTNIDNAKISEVAINDVEATLTVNSGMDFVIFSDNIEIVNSSIEAKGGRVFLVSAVDNNQKFYFDEEFDSHEINIFKGNVTLERANNSKTKIDASSTDLDITNQFGNGSIIVRAKNFNMKGFLGNNFPLPGQVNNGSELLADSIGSVDGSIRAVDIVVEDTVSIKNGSFISSSKLGSGRSGDIFIDAQTIKLRTEGRILADNADSGSGSNILIESDNLSIDGEGSGIQAGSSSPNGRGGLVDLRIRDKIKLGKVDETDLAGGSIDVSTNNSGLAGDINICKVNGCRPDLTIGEGGFVKAASAGFEEDSAAGEIAIYANNVELKNEAKIFTRNTGKGKSGSTEITAKNITLVGSSEITSSAEGAATGGTIVLEADDINVLEKSVISATTSGSGEGGSIKLISETGAVSILDGEITANSTFETGSSELGQSGNISVDASKIHLSGDEDTKISVSTLGSHAGNILLDYGAVLRLQGDANITTSVSSKEGDGGNISINGVNERNVTVLEDKSKVLANTEEGEGGVITFNVQSVLRSAESEVSAAARNKEIGIDGEVIFNTPDVDATSGALELPETYFDASSLIASRCAIQGQSHSSFIVTQRDGLSASPDLLLAGYEDFDEFNSTNPSIESLVVANDTRNALGRINCSR